MAEMYIQEYTNLSVDGRGFQVQAGQEPAVTSQKVSFTTSTASAAFDETTRFVRITCDADAHLQFAVAPTATTSMMEVQADTPEFFGVIKGQKVAAVVQA